MFSRLVVNVVLLGSRSEAALGFKALQSKSTASTPLHVAITIRQVYDHSLSYLHIPFRGAFACFDAIRCLLKNEKCLTTNSVADFT
jgi:hypothetical protein